MAECDEDCLDQKESVLSKISHTYEPSTTQEFSGSWSNQKILIWKWCLRNEIMSQLKQEDVNQYSSNGYMDPIDVLKNKNGQDKMKLVQQKLDGPSLFKNNGRFFEMPRLKRIEQNVVVQRRLMEIKKIFQKNQNLNLKLNKSIIITNRTNVT